MKYIFDGIEIPTYTLFVSIMKRFTSDYNCYFNPDDFESQVLPISDERIEQLDETLKNYLLMLSKVNI